MLRTDAAGSERLTDLRAKVTALTLGRVESLRRKGHDGLSLEGVLTLPPAFGFTRSYPLLLTIHGGPSASSRETF